MELVHKAWALSVVPHFSLSPPHLTFFAWVDFDVCSGFTHYTIPEEKWGLVVALLFTLPSVRICRIFLYRLFTIAKWEQYFVTMLSLALLSYCVGLVKM